MTCPVEEKQHRFRPCDPSFETSVTKRLQKELNSSMIDVTTAVGKTLACE